MSTARQWQPGIDTDRRVSKDRRVVVDQRKTVRFDNKGGDRRTGAGRRSTDVHLTLI